VTGEADADEWFLADRLGMTRHELITRMGNAEYLSWKAYYLWKSEQERLHAR
jgi:hypothetical protein